MTGLDFVWNSGITSTANLTSAAHTGFTILAAGSGLLSGKKLRTAGNAGVPPNAACVLGAGGFRSEGPAFNRPGRQAGINVRVL